MTKFKNIFRIESARLKDWDYSTPWRYFVTIDTFDHSHFFGTVTDNRTILNTLGEIVKHELLRTESIRKNVRRDSYVIMPNHIHIIIEILEPVDMSTIDTQSFSKQSYNKNFPKAFLSHIIKGFKSAVTKAAREHGFHNFAWQSRFYDRVIRSDVELYFIRNYIEMNPANWELHRNELGK